ncbi:hypothetical protein RHGRI_021554 [Rhododendron griersonianum]|uniref:Uncharacterized protein n=1 Tax=Rhododendron griersonianum TaxID=479676 RepID=A0AAV6JKL6_9ERIC|nr:hypothetical protein RHGRI_021554 [Rhododendron griersonianum]
MVPHSAQGHINPMLKVAKLLYQKGFYMRIKKKGLLHHLRRQRVRQPAVPPSSRAQCPRRPPGLEVRGRTRPGSLLRPAHEERALALALALLQAVRRRAGIVGASADVPPITCIVCDRTLKFPLVVAENSASPRRLSGPQVLVGCCVTPTFTNSWKG